LAMPTPSIISPRRCKRGPATPTSRTWTTRRTPSTW